MAALFVIGPGFGHLYPTLPFARALRRRGVDVIYAMVEVDGFRRVVEDEGFDFVSVPPDADEQRRIVAHGLEHDPTLAGIFGPLAPPAVDPLVALIAAHRIALVVHDVSTFAAPLAAALAGVPSVHHGLGPCFLDDVEGAAEWIAPLWRRHGIEPPELGGLFGTFIDIVPPSLANPCADRATHAVRPEPLSLTVGDETSIDTLPDELVWASLGTVFHHAADVWRDLVAGLADVPLPVVLTNVPDTIDLGTLPRHVSRHGFVSAATLIDRSCAVVSHAGAGTVLAALSRGVPLVCVPQGADQFHNAEAVVGAGAGRSVLPGERMSGAIAAAISAVLSGPDARAAARRVAAEIAVMPSPDAVADQIIATIR